MKFVLYSDEEKQPPKVRLKLVNEGGQVALKMVDETGISQTALAFRGDGAIELYSLADTFVARNELSVTVGRKIVCE